MSNLATDGAAVVVVVNQPNSDIGTWKDTRTWLDSDAAKSEWITKSHCAELWAVRFGLDPEGVRWYGLENLRVDVTGKITSDKIATKIRGRLVGPQIPGRPVWVHHKQDVLNHLDSLDFACIRDGSWNDECDCWTSIDGQTWAANQLINLQVRKQRGETQHPEWAHWPPTLVEYEHVVASYNARKVKGKIRVLLMFCPQRQGEPCKIWNLADAAEVKRLIEKKDKQRRKAHGKALKKKLKLNRQQKDGDGKLWFSLGYFVTCLRKFFPVHRSTVFRWSHDGHDREAYCVYLGRAVNVKQFDDGNGKMVDFLSKDDYDLIVVARKKITKDRASISFDEAIKIIPAPENTAKNILKTVSPSKALATRKDKRPLRMSRFEITAIERIAEKLEKYFENPTITKAARILGADTDKINELVASELLPVVPPPYPNCGFRGTRVDGQRLKELQKHRASDISVDQEGVWIPFLQAPRINPNATATLLYKYAGKECPQLSGAILRAKQMTERVKGRGSREEGNWKVHEDDLNNFQAAKVGMPGQRAAASARRRALLRAQSGPSNPAYSVPMAPVTVLPEALTSVAAETQGPASGIKRVAYGALGIEVDLTNQVIYSDEKSLDFSESNVQWHIFKVALEKYPQQVTMEEMMKDYPGEEDKIARNMSTYLLNKRLALVGLRVLNRVLTVIR